MEISEFSVITRVYDWLEHMEMGGVSSSRWQIFGFDSCSIGNGG